jgi:hypothetical protein
VDKGAIALARVTRFFGPQFLALVSALSLSCAGSHLPVDDPDMGGEGGAPPGPTGGSGGSAIIDAAPVVFVDRPIDLPYDNPPAQPDAAPREHPPSSDPNAVVLETCEQMPCQQLFVAAAECNGAEQMCTSAVPAMDRANYCLGNGVRKYVTNMSPTDTSYMTSVRVTRPDGKACYTLYLSGSDGSDLETLVWRAPNGDVWLTGMYSKSREEMLLSCQGVNYNPREVGCPGLEGEPDPAACTAGSCAE